jgi:hypothetical protein
MEECFMTSPLRWFSVQNGRRDRSLSSRPYLIEIAVISENVLYFLEN